MAKLAIKGHPIRGKEVIKTLEMLGGFNKHELHGNVDNYYYCLIDGIINYIPKERCNTIFRRFTLEQFLEKYPYKVGDKIDLNGDKVDITGFYWNVDEISYEGSVKLGREYDCISVKDMKPWIEQKEEIMEETKKDLDWHPTDYLEFVDNDDTWAEEVELNLGDSYEIQVRDGKTFVVKKKPQYPTTYEECCDILGIPNDERYIVIDVPLSYNGLLKSFTQLLVCRDAYWKMAGEWKPNWMNIEQYKYVLYTDNNNICSNCYVLGNNPLALPTKEMRNSFYENFKELIESCKELL